MEPLSNDYVGFCRQKSLSVTQDENIDMFCQQQQQHGDRWNVKVSNIQSDCCWGLRSRIRVIIFIFWLRSNSPLRREIPNTHTNTCSCNSGGGKILSFPPSSSNICMFYWEQKAYGLNVNIEWFERDSLRCFCHPSTPCVYKVSGHFYRKRTGLLTFSKRKVIYSIHLHTYIFKGLTYKLYL